MLLARTAFDVPSHWRAGRELAGIVVARRELVWELTQRAVRDRFAGLSLGALWALGHPILLMALYVAVFTYVFPARGVAVGGATISLSQYILAGLIPWLSFQEVLVGSATIFPAHASLVKQIVFPIEVLPIKAVLAATPTQLVATVVLVGLAAATGGLSWSFLLFPLAFALQLACMSAAAFVLGSIGAYFRDLREVMAFFCSANLFLMPVLYAPDQLPAALRGLLWFNPFSHLAWVYQDTFFFGRIEHPASWIVLAVGGIGGLVLGYRVFRRMRTGFGDVL